LLPTNRNKGGTIMLRRDISAASLKVAGGADINKKEK